MLSFFRKSIPTVIALAILSCIGIYAGYRILTPKKKLPVYNPADVNPKLVDTSMQHIKKYHIIADFSLTDQNGQTVTNATYKNKIYVADFFFTRCPSICIDMARNMKVIQEAFKDDPSVMLLSHSVTPKQDSVAVLRSYADAKGVVDDKWRLVTGDKKQIYKLARKSYFAVLDEGDGGMQDFIHTENFILVDTKRRIRGFYDGTDTKSIRQLISDIKLLKKELRDQI